MASSPPDLEVRQATAADDVYAEAASQLIQKASKDHDIAERSPDWLRGKIRGGKAAVALQGDQLIGFGYFSDWQDGKFVSHSGLVVDDAFRGHGLGRRLKQQLMAGTRRLFPDATMMSLTTSPAVKAMNLSLGFRVVPLDQLTSDQSFWDGCKTCRNYAEVQARGERCCCEGMILPAESEASS